MQPVSTGFGTFLTTRGIYQYLPLGLVTIGEPEPPRWLVFFTIVPDSWLESSLHCCAFIILPPLLLLHSSVNSRRSVKAGD